METIADVSKPSSKWTTTAHSTGTTPMSRATPNPRPPEADRKTKSTILVVDDEKDILELVTYNLQRNGYTVLTATSGDQALALAEKKPARPGAARLDAPRHERHRRGPQAEGRPAHVANPDHHADRQERRDRRHRRPHAGRRRLRVQAVQHEDFVGPNEHGASPWRTGRR